MQDDPKLVDLEPHKWRSDRPKPREPFFGQGAAPFVVEVAVGVVALGLLFLAFTMAGTVKDKFNSVFFGEEKRSPILQPGQSTTINGVKIERIN